MDKNKSTTCVGKTPYLFLSVWIMYLFFHDKISFENFYIIFSISNVPKQVENINYIFDEFFLDLLP